MKRYCNLNVIKYCLGVVVIKIIIDSSLDLINCRKKLPDTKTYSFYQKTVGYLSISALLSLTRW